MAGDSTARNSGLETRSDQNEKTGLAAELWSKGFIDCFPSIDKDKDGFITRKEMESTPDSTAKQKFLDNFADLQLPVSIGTAFSRTIGGKEGVALSDLEEIRERAKSIPLELRLNARVEDALSRNFSGHELRHGRFRQLNNAAGLNPDDKQVFDYVEKNWRNYKTDIGNQLNRDEAIIPRALPQKVREQNARLEERFRIVRQLAK